MNVSASAMKEPRSTTKAMQNRNIWVQVSRYQAPDANRDIGDIVVFFARTVAGLRSPSMGLFLRPAGGPAPGGFYSSMAPPVRRRCCRKV